MAMKKYVRYTVQIPLEEESELHKRIKMLAQRMNIPPEDVVAATVQLGVYGHMECNMALYEKSPGR